MMRAARLAAVVAPVLGLGALWVQSDRTFHQGTEWLVPVQGYDPRDLLRGHYVEFEYDWPGFEEAALGFPGPQRLCLEGTPPRQYRARVMATASEQAACAHPLRAPDAGIYGTQGLMRGRLYLGQDRAAALEQGMRDRDRRAVVTIRQREDGSFSVIGLRLRPLTAAERAERDAPREEPFAPLGPPAVMDK